MLFFKKFIFLLCLFIFVSYTIFAQDGYRQPVPNTLIIGTLKNWHPQEKEISLIVNTRYIDQTEVSYGSNLLGNEGRFAFAVELNSPQIIQIKYGKKTTQFFAEPGDTLQLEGDANSFHHSFKYRGRGALNNYMYRDFAKKYHKKINVFQVRQYKKGINWHRVDPFMDSLMVNSNSSNFLIYINSMRAKRLASIPFFEYNNVGKLTEGFTKFLKTEIEYEWAFNLLTFAYVFEPYKKELNRVEYLKILDKIPLYSDEIGSPRYRNYLLARINYLQNTSTKNVNKEKNPYEEQYRIGKKELKEGSLTWSFFLSNILVRAFKKDQKSVILDEYTNFVEYNPNYDFDKLPVVEYQRALRYAIGSTAPNFILQDENGVDVSLSDYKGKLVYLDFWATWCRPCVKKIDEMREFRKRLTGKGVIFLHISLDRRERTWKKMLKAKEYDGIHLLAVNNIDSKVAEAYGVEALPHFFIITKKGTFAGTPRSNRLKDLEAHLENLLKEE